MDLLSDASYNVSIREEGIRNLGSDGTSGWIWFAARALEKQILSLLSENNDHFESAHYDEIASIKNNIRNLHILELGSGTGWLPLRLAVALRGASIVATERPCSMPSLTRNIYQNIENFENCSLTHKNKNEIHSLEIDVQTLEWDKNETVPGNFDLIIGSDILYLEEYYLDLLNTIIRHSIKCDFPLVMISWEERKSLEENQFLTLAVKHGFKFDPPKVIATNSGTNNHIFLLIMVYNKQI